MAHLAFIATLLVVARVSPDGGSLAFVQEGGAPLYKDPDAAISDRVHDLLQRMTVEEKVAQLESGWTIPSMGTMANSSAFDQGEIYQATAKKIAGNGLGT